MDVSQIAVTGVSGRIGQRLLREFDADPSIDRVVGLDVREPSFRPRKLDFHAVDVGGADLKPLLEGTDVLIHLAFLLEPLPDVAVMERVNVEGTRRILDAASATAVDKIVFVSSAYAYGAHPGNPVPLTEDNPLRPNSGLAFTIHQAEIERLLSEWTDEHPGVVTSVLRPPFVLGDGTPSSVRALVLSRLPFTVRDASPDVQYLHVDDLVSAVTSAVSHDLPGPYNVAAEGWLAAEDVDALLGRSPRVSVSADLAERLLGRLWLAGVTDVPPGFVPLLTHPCVVANDRLRAAGWKPAHTNEDALLALLEETGRLRRRSRGRGWQIATAAAGLTGLGAAGWALWRRRR